MYIRRKVFSVKEENGEQKLFSTTEIKNEVQKEFSDKKEEKKDEDTKKEKNLKKAAIASSGVGLAGSAGALASAIKLNKIAENADKKIDKIAKKKNVKRIGDTYFGELQKIQEASELSKRYGDKIVKHAKKIDKAGKIAGGVGLAGGAVSIGSALAYKKSKKDKAKESEKKD